MGICNELHSPELMLDSTENSINVLEEAIKQKNELPSRYKHLGLFLNVPFGFIGNLVLRVGAIVTNFFSIPFILCSDKKCETLKVRLSRVLLDPLHFLTEIIRSTMRIVAFVLGLADPRWAANLWRTAEQVEALMLRRYYQTSKEKQPSKADAAGIYLGQEKAAELLRSLQPGLLNRLKSKLLP